MQLLVDVTLDPDLSDMIGAARPRAEAEAVQHMQDALLSREVGGFKHVCFSGWLRLRAWPLRSRCCPPRSSPAPQSAAAIETPPPAQGCGCRRYRAPPPRPAHPLLPTPQPPEQNRQQQ